MTERAGSLNLSIRRDKTLEFIEEEKKKRGGTKTGILNELLETVAAFPHFFASPDQPKLKELSALQKLLLDPAMKQIPAMAAATRRDPLRMLLYVVDQGVKSIETELPDDFFQEDLPD